MPLGALTAASATMLFWAMAAAVPVIIHFLSRRKVREEDWAAMQFLLAAIQRSSRRLRIEQLILLMLRVTTLVVFAVGLADVSCQQSSHLASSAVDQSATHTVLVIDNSYSMDYRWAGESCFERAQAAAKSLVERAEEGDAFTIVTLGDPARATIASPVYDLGEVVHEIRQLRTQQRGASLGNTLTKIRSVLEDARAAYPRLTREKVFFFTDLCRSTWGAVTTSICEREIQRIADRAALVLVDVGVADAVNFAVTALRISNPAAHASQMVEFDADVRQFGAVESGQRTIQWFVDDERVHQQEVTVSAEKDRISVRFEHRFESAGEHTVELRCDDDALVVDNHRWLAVFLAQQFDVLCVRGKKNAARFVHFALQSGQPRIQSRIVSELELLGGNLDRFDCLFLCNIGRIGAEETRELSNYVRNGGGLVIFLGDLIVAENYNRQLGGLENPQRLLPAEVGNARTAAHFGFDPLNYEHTIVQPFRGNSQAGLLTTPVWKYFQLSPYESDELSVALSFVDGDPAIVTERFGHGRVVIVATPASTASLARNGDSTLPWSGLATWPSFPPLVHRMLEFAVSGHRAKRNLEVGQTIQVVVPGGRTGAPVYVTTPDRRRVQFHSSRSPWTYPDTTLSGIYRVQLAGPAAENHYFAANVNTAESNTARFPRSQLPALLRRAEDPQKDRGIVISEGRTSIFRWALGCVFALLLVETLLSWRFGRGRV